MFPAAGVTFHSSQKKVFFFRYKLSPATIYIFLEAGNT